MYGTYKSKSEIHNIVHVPFHCHKSNKKKGSISPTEESTFFILFFKKYFFLYHDILSYVISYSKHFEKIIKRVIHKVCIIHKISIKALLHSPFINTKEVR